MKTSTNIIRDGHDALAFIPTPNGQSLFDQILNNRQAEQGAHLLIGSFGTGKSTFLWALEHTVNQKKSFFKFNKAQGKGRAFFFLKLIGDPSSFEICLKAAVSAELGQEVGSALNGVRKLRDQLAEEQTELVIVVDEFGKHLEFAQQQQGSKDEIYFLQQLAEEANQKEKGFLLIATLHQNIESYTGFHQQLKNEWRKVAGRFVELAFNEPIEHLFQIAARKLEETRGEKPESQAAQRINRTVLPMNLFGNGSDRSDSALASALAPLDWMSANFLFRALKDYGQNERSLFGFLDSEHPMALKCFEDVHYGLKEAFQYIMHVFGSKLREYTNPHRSIWASIDRALERISSLEKTHYADYEQVVQTVGMIHLFGREGQKFGFEELTDLIGAQGIESAQKRVEELQKAKILTFFRHKNQVSFLEGTDMDLTAELAVLHAQVEERFSVSRSLKSRVNISEVLVRKHFIKTGAARFVSFEILDGDGTLRAPEGFYDLTVGVQIGNSASFSIESGSEQQVALAQLTDFESLSTELLELEKLQELLKQKDDDISAQRILRKEIGFLAHRIQQIFFKHLYSEQTKWKYDGRELHFSSERSFLREAANIMDRVYSKAPSMPNDLINREKLSTNILTARKKLIHDLLSKEGEEDLGYALDKYPPERSIFLSFIQEQGMYRENRVCMPEKDSTLYPLAEAGMEFLRSCSLGKRNLAELHRIYSAPPFKLKRGLQDYWIPLLLIAHRFDIGLYHENGEFIPYLSEDILDRIHKKPQDFLLRFYAENPVEEDQLHSYLQVFPDGEKAHLKNTYMSIYGGLLTFMRNLPEYSKQTQKLSLEAIGLRDEVSKADDPSSCLFERIPQILGVQGIKQEQFEERLRNALIELRQAYPQLLERIEQVLHQFLGTSNDTQQALRERFRGVNKQVLTHELRILLERIMAPLDEYSNWIKSLADAAYGSNIERLTDEDEPRLIDKLHRQLQILDNQQSAQELLKEYPAERVYTLRLENANGQGAIRHAVLPETTELNGQMQKLVDHLTALPLAERMYLLNEILKKEEKEQ